MSPACSVTEVCIDLVCYFISVPAALLLLDLHSRCYLCDVSLILHYRAFSRIHGKKWRRKIGQPVKRQRENYGNGKKGNRTDVSQSWTTHINVTIAKASKRLYFLRQLKRPTQQLLRFYTAVICPVLDYACHLWHHVVT